MLVSYSEIMRDSADVLLRHPAFGAIEEKGQQDC
jgi:hypothetical protein